MTGRIEFPPAFERLVAVMNAQVMHSASPDDEMVGTLVARLSPSDRDSCRVFLDAFFRNEPHDGNARRLLDRAGFDFHLRKGEALTLLTTLRDLLRPKPLFPFNRYSWT